MSEISFRIGTESDKARVKVFLKEHFFVDEPICKSENAAIDEGSLDKIVRCLEFGTCTLAEDSTGKLIGVRLAKPRTPEDVDNLNIDIPKTTLDRMWRMVYDLALNANTFERFGVEKIMHSMVLGVDKDYRGKGLGTQLYKENMKLAKELGYTVYTCDCTSLFSAKACLRLGFDIIYEIAYTDYKDEKDVQIFRPSPPHDKLRVLAKVL